MDFAPRLVAGQARFLSTIDYNVVTFVENQVILLIFLVAKVQNAADPHAFFFPKKRFFEFFREILGEFWGDCEKSGPEFVLGTH